MDTENALTNAKESPNEIFFEEEARLWAEVYGKQSDKPDLESLQRMLEVHYILPTGVRNRLWGKLQAKNACNLSKAGFPASHYKMLVTAKILFFKYKYGISVDLLIRISTIASIVIWQQFCSHALTNCLYPFIHRSFRCGSNCGGRYESKRLLSLCFVLTSIVSTLLSFDLQDVNIWHLSY